MFIPPLHYTITGKGNPVVLVHGFAEDSTIWNKQKEFLQTNHQLLIPDLRGTGHSSAMQAPTSIEQMADDIKWMLDKESITTCTMIGHSMGGYITLAFAQKYPTRINGFGLIHSTSYADNEEKKIARNKSIDFITQNTAYEFIKTTIPNLFADAFKQNHPQQVAELIEDGKQFSKEVLIAYTKAMIERADRTTVLKETTVPVLYFIGADDKAVNPSDALQQTALPTICKVQLVEGIAHMGMWEATETLNKTLDEFLMLVQQTQD